MVDLIDQPFVIFSRKEMNLVILGIHIKIPIDIEGTICIRHISRDRMAAGFCYCTEDFDIKRLRAFISNYIYDITFFYYLSLAERKVYENIRVALHELLVWQIHAVIIAKTALFGAVLVLFVLALRPLDLSVSSLLFYNALTMA